MDEIGSEIRQLLSDVERIPCSDLTGIHIYTIGDRFHGLSTRCFRTLLRHAGAVIDPRARKSTDMIVVGENPSRSSIIKILLTLSEKSRPPFVPQDAFLVRFLSVLGPLALERGGVSFCEHVDRHYGILLTNDET